MKPADWSFLKICADTAPMVRRGEQMLTARDVKAEATRLLAALVSSREPVFLYCEDSGNFIAGLIAVLSAGRDVLLPGHAAPGYLAEIGARGSRLLTDVKDLDADAILISVEPAPQDVQFADLEPDPRATISFYTSGSTGVPKICSKLQSQILGEAASQLNFWGAPKGPVISTVSHQHIYGLLFYVFWPLMAGVPVEASRQDMWEDVVFHVAPDCVFISSPAHLSRIPDGLSLPSRPAYIFSSGGPLSFAAAQDALKKFGLLPTEVLGSTETGGVAFRRQAMEGEHWTILPLVEIMADENGVLAVKSPFTGSPDFVAMGDQVTRHPDGRFSLHARVDRIVKIEGKRVSLPRVEEALRDLPQIKDCSVIDLPDRNGVLGAIVVLEQASLSALADLGAFRFSRQIRRDMSARLEPMELPKVWRFVDRVPENTQGKRLVGDLRKLFATELTDLPHILSRDISENVAEFTLELHADLRWFDGHFPDQPILPGVAQLHIASVLAEDVWGFVATGAEMARVKFRRVMQPGDHVALVLTRTNNERLDFRYSVEGDIAASGAIKGIEV